MRFGIPADDGAGLETTSGSADPDMSERSRVVVLLVLSAVVLGLLTWAVVGPDHRRCMTAVLGQRLTNEQAENLDRAFRESNRTCGSWLSSAAFPSPNAADTRRTPVKHPRVHGRVVVWHDELGWGVLASKSVKGEVWTHFSNIKGEGYRTLKRGDAITFTYETPGQDGYPHRAISVSRP